MSEKSELGLCAPANGAPVDRRLASHKSAPHTAPVEKTRYPENLMTQPTKRPQRAPGPIHSAPPVDVSKLRQEAEAKEVAGRHKNSGQKDHKGAR
jgi:hypothetical protein